jgi:hypothetical protein
MRHTKVTAPLAIALALSLIGGGCASPEQKAERKESKAAVAEFVKTHEYDHFNQEWHAKGGGPPMATPPAQLRSRAEVKAERDEFLAKNRWDQPSGRFVPISGPPRELSTMSRDQVRQETDMYLRTHYYDEVTDTWMEK